MTTVKGSGLSYFQHIIYFSTVCTSVSSRARGNLSCNIWVIYSRHLIWWLVAQERDRKRWAGAKINAPIRGSFWPGNSWILMHPMFTCGAPSVPSGGAMEEKVQHIAPEFPALHGWETIWKSNVHPLDINLISNIIEIVYFLKCSKSRRAGYSLKGFLHTFSAILRQ